MARLKALTAKFSDQEAEREKSQAKRQADRLDAEATRRFSDEIDSLKTEFMTLQSGSDVHKRGYAFEALLAKLFLLFDMEPRLAYSLDREQIDGALTFDTDDYVVTRRSRFASDTCLRTRRVFS